MPDFKYQNKENPNFDIKEVVWEGDERKDYLEVINHAYLLSGDDIFMMHRGVSIKIQQISYDLDLIQNIQNEHKNKEPDA